MGILHSNFFEFELELPGPLDFAASLEIFRRSGDVAGTTGGLFNILTKANNILYALRDRWRWFDWLSILLVMALLVYAMVGRTMAWARGLALAAILLGLIYLLLPQRIFGSSYADMRLLPYTIATALLAIRPMERTRLLANTHHLSNHVRKNIRSAQRLDETPALLDSRANVDDGLFDHHIASRAGSDVQRLQNRHAGRQKR